MPVAVAGSAFVAVIVIALIVFVLAVVFLRRRRGV
jgi:hypothetical protein